MVDRTEQLESALADADVMLRYGITCVPTDRFHYKTFRHSTLSAAIAHAQRDEAIAPRAVRIKAMSADVSREQGAGFAERREPRVKAALAIKLAELDRQLSENPDRGVAT